MLGYQQRLVSFKRLAHYPAQGPYAHIHAQDLTAVFLLRQFNNLIDKCLCERHLMHAAVSAKYLFLFKVYACCLRLITQQVEQLVNLALKNSTHFQSGVNGLRNDSRKHAVFGRREPTAVHARKSDNLI